MEKKTDHGPIAYFCGLVFGFIIGHYLPEDTTRWQDILLGIVVFFVPLIRTPGSERKD